MPMIRPRHRLVLVQPQIDNELPKPICEGCVCFEASSMGKGDQNLQHRTRDVVPHLIEWSTCFVEETLSKFKCLDIAILIASDDYYELRSVQEVQKIEVDVRRSATLYDFCSEPIEVLFVNRPRHN